MLKILTQISRFFVGALFIYSGFVKLVDPKGTQFKMEEYFSEAVFNLEFLIPLALPIAILLVVAELVLGVMLIMGYLPKITVWSLFALTLVFLFLTWYSYTYNKVTDCGCFGDAIKLTPGETFYKNVFIFPLIILMIYGLQYIKPLPNLKIASYTSYASLLISLFIVYYVLQNLPIIDFRAYSIGTNIPEGMKYNGEEEPPIHDFALEHDEKGDLTDELLSKDKVMLIIVYNMDKADKEGYPEVKKVAEAAKSSGYTVYGVSASYIDDLVELKKQYELPFDFLFCDETALKTVIRSNPGIMTLSNGNITGKYSWGDANDVEF